MFLKQRGHEVTRATGGEAALDLLRRQTFDLLITDVDMPGMNGLSLISHDDAMDGLQGVIVLTGRTYYELLAVEQGRRNLRTMPKPLSPVRLTEMVEEFLTADASVS